MDREEAVTLLGRVENRRRQSVIGTCCKLPPRDIINRAKHKRIVGKGAYSAMGAVPVR